MALPDIKHVAFPLHGDIVHEPKFFDQLLQDVLQELAGENLLKFL